MNKIFKDNRAFSIVEVTAVLGIISMGLLGISALSIQNLQTQSINENYVVASMLAQEGLELVRNIRDENWLSTAAIDWNDDLNSSSFTIDIRGRDDINDIPDSINDNGTELYFDNDFYIHDDNAGANEDSGFRRIINITEDASGDFIGASSTVDWQERGRRMQYVAETYFYNWR